jgi:hypothetical protein
MQCVVKDCNRAGVEFHHFAPRAIFGPTADAWPRVWLCTVHHAAWHRRVWPGRTKIRREIAARIRRRVAP